MESYFLCYTCGSLVSSSIDIDLCTRCGRRYCRAHRPTHRCDDAVSPPWSTGTEDCPKPPVDTTPGTVLSELAAPASVGSTTRMWTARL